MFKVLDEVCTPQRGTKYSAYVDLFAREDVVIGAGETKIVKLGVKIDLEKLNDCVKKDLYTDDIASHRFGLHLDYFMQSHYLEVALRSSLAVKGLIIANGIGVIDLDYPDEIGLIVHNPISEQTINKQSNSNFSLFGFSNQVNQSNSNSSKQFKASFEIKKGDKVAQCTLKEHKGYLMGYESDVVRNGGFGSTGA